MDRHGVRMDWRDVPAPFRAEVQDAIGAEIVDAVNVVGGFSPGPAARCMLSDGRRVFIKAGGNSLNQTHVDLLRTEASALVALPSSMPAPQLLHVIDRGGWVCLVLEALDGSSPTAPIDDATLAHVLAVTDELAAVGTPSPVSGLHPFGDARGPSTLDDEWAVLLGDGLADRLDSRLRAALPDLVALECGWRDAIAGGSLVHGDLRIDNIVVTPERTFIVDWPCASTGAPWIDLVAMLPSLHHDGAPPPHEVLERTTVGSAADPDRVTCFIAVIAGYFMRRSLLPPPPGVERVRSFQASQALVSLDWLAHRTTLDV